MKFLDSLFLTKELITTDEGVHAVLQTNPSHLIYQAHFPGNPITPGVCILQIAGELLERVQNRQVWLKTAKNLKFLSSIVPEEGKLVKYDFSYLAQTLEECKVQVVVTDDKPVVCTKMTLVFSYERL